jgi:hypothetical protein
MISTSIAKQTYRVRAVGWQLLSITFVLGAAMALFGASLGDSASRSSTAATSRVVTRAPLTPQPLPGPYPRPSELTGR